MRRNNIIGSIRDLICIGCPIGCMIQVKIEADIVINVAGNTCKRGEIYGIKKCTNPTKNVTSSDAVEGGNLKAVSVKIKSDITKEKIFECLDPLKGFVLKSPVRIGEVVVKNVANIGIDIVATKSIN